MNTTIRKTMWLLAVAVALTSCVKNDGPKPDGDGSDGSGNGDLLLAEEKVNGKSELTFEYDERNRVSIRYVYNVDGTVASERFTYEDRDRLSAVQHSVGLSETYSYETADRPVSGVWTYSNDNMAMIQYDYTQNTVTETIFIEGGSTVNIYTFDKNGNPISQQIGHILIEYGDYDDKPSCYTHHPWSWKTAYTNNCRSIKTTVSGAVVSDHIWEYTYNDAGYPVKAEVYDRESDQLVETHEYRYIAAN